ncbi:hypothetical protein CRM73_00125 [Kocuria sp. CCUG 69068]|uniref:DUF5361 domain-containing protein n=1 Tax=Kocuria sp. CCUG 69068 TaxID=2043138 RepID=UPI001E5C4292|nr:hypothetical protein [Kocuria sp. CCUG 69068]
MERAVRDVPGGITDLAGLLEEHGEAIEFDLLSTGGGYRLRWLDSATTMAARDFNWRDLYVIVEFAPRSSALVLSTDGSEAVEWDLTRHLLASMADALNWLQWAKTEEAQKPGANPPEPIQRPGVQSTKKHYGTGALDEDDMIEWLGDRFAHLKTES